MPSRASSTRRRARHALERVAGSLRSTEEDRLAALRGLARPEHRARHPKVPGALIREMLEDAGQIVAKAPAAPARSSPASWMAVVLEPVGTGYETDDDPTTVWPTPATASDSEMGGPGRLGARSGALGATQAMTWCQLAAPVRPTRASGGMALAGASTPASRQPGDWCGLARSGADVAVTGNHRGAGTM